MWAPSAPWSYHRHLPGSGWCRRHSGKRLGKSIGALVPLTLSNLAKNDDLLREDCFQVRGLTHPITRCAGRSLRRAPWGGRRRQTIETLATRCPEETGPFVDAIVAACLQYVKYDPNYVDDEADAGDDDGGVRPAAMAGCARVLGR